MGWNGWSSISSPTAICSRAPWVGLCVQSRYRGDGDLRSPRPLGRPKLQKPAQRAIQFIVNVARPGRWRLASTLPVKRAIPRSSDGRSSRLRSGNMSGIKVPKKVLKACSRYLDTVSDQKRVIYSYQAEPAPVARHDRRRPGEPAVARLAA